jgi:integrase
MVRVPKVRGLLWREHPQGSQTRPVTKRRGDWWISWKCRSHHRHREKVGPRGLALEEYHRRRTQSRREGFCPRLQRRAVATVFEDLAARWLRDHARVVKRSWTSDRHRIETLKSHFGRSTLTEITPDRVDRYRSDRLTAKRKGRKRTISPTTVNKEVALLKAMLNRAIAWGLLDVNPILRVKKLREPEGRVRYLEPEEIDRLLAACPPHLRPIVVCALHTGMRRGEILGLTWDRVDLKNRLIRVTGTKSGKARMIPINDPFWRSCAVYRAISRRTTCSGTTRPRPGSSASRRRGQRLSGRPRSPTSAFTTCGIMPALVLCRVAALREGDCWRISRSRLRWTRHNQRLSKKPSRWSSGR